MKDFIVQESKVDISVVVPVYLSSKSIFELIDRLESVLPKISEKYEIILIDDGSPDDSWEKIEKLSTRDARIKGIQLSRNFGQHHAITAGLDFADGKWVVVMDCDLQDRPEEIVSFYNKAQEGFDVVVGRRTGRQDAPGRKIFSKLFLAIYRFLTGVNWNSEIGNFGIYSSVAIRNVQQLREKNRSFGTFIYWVGFKRIEIDIKHAERAYGTSSYTISKLIRLALDSFFANSNKLLEITICLGFAIAILSVLASIWLIAKYLLWSISVSGWTSLMVVICLSTGLIIGSIGVVGLYVGKIFDEVKNRPIYIVKKQTF